MCFGFRPADFQAQLCRDTTSSQEEAIPQDKDRDSAKSHYDVAAVVPRARWAKLLSRRPRGLSYVMSREKGRRKKGREAADLLFVNPRRHS